MNSRNRNSILNDTNNTFDLPVEPVESNIEYDNEKRNTSDYFDNEKINKFYKSALKS